MCMLLKIALCFSILHSVEPKSGILDLFPRYQHNQLASKVSKLGPGDKPDHKKSSGSMLDALNKDSLSSDAEIAFNNRRGHYDRISGSKEKAALKSWSEMSKQNRFRWLYRSGSDSLKKTKMLQEEKISRKSKEDKSEMSGFVTTQSNTQVDYKSQDDSRKESKSSKRKSKAKNEKTSGSVDKSEKTNYDTGNSKKSNKITSTASIWKSEEKSEKSSKKKSEKLSNDKSESSSKEKSGKSNKEESEKSSKDKSEKSSKEKSEKSSNEKSEKSNEDKSEKSSKMKSPKSSIDKSEKSRNEKSGESSKEKSEKSSKKKSEKSSKDKSEKSSKEKSEKSSKEKSEKSSKENSEKPSKIKSNKSSKEKSKTLSKDKSEKSNKEKSDKLSLKKFYQSEEDKTKKSSDNEPSLNKKDKKISKVDSKNENKSSKIKSKEKSEKSSKDKSEKSSKEKTDNVSSKKSTSSKEDKTEKSVDNNKPHSKKQDDKMQQENSKIEEKSSKLKTKANTDTNEIISIPNRNSQISDDEEMGKPYLWPPKDNSQNNGFQRPLTENIKKRLETPSEDETHSKEQNNEISPQDSRKESRTSRLSSKEKVNEIADESTSKEISKLSGKEDNQFTLPKDKDNQFGWHPKDKSQNSRWPQEVSSKNFHWPLTDQSKETAKQSSDDKKSSAEKVLDEKKSTKLPLLEHKSKTFQWPIKNKTQISGWPLKGKSKEFHWPPKAKSKELPWTPKEKSDKLPVMSNGKSNKEGPNYPIKGESDIKSDQQPHSKEDNSFFPKEKVTDMSTKDAGIGAKSEDSKRKSKTEQEELPRFGPSMKPPYKNAKVCSKATPACCVGGELTVKLNNARGKQSKTGKLDGVYVIEINKGQGRNRKKSCSSNALVMVDFEKIDTTGCVGCIEAPYCGKRMLKIELKLSNAKRGGWMFNVGDSETNNGYRGDSDDQMNDAETQALFPNITIYPSDRCPSISSLMHIVDAVANNVDTVSLYISNEHIRITNSDGLDFKLCHKCLYALNGQQDSGPKGGPNEAICIGLNRVVKDLSRTGYGVCSATFSWMCPWCM